MNSQRSRKNLLFIALSILSIFGYGFFVFAAPPGSGGYNPGETLDPECIPGDTDCIVALPLSGGVAIGDVVGNNPDQNGILYTDATGQVTTDPLFTRDALTKDTNILRTYTDSFSKNWTAGFSNLQDIGTGFPGTGLSANDDVGNSVNISILDGSAYSIDSGLFNIQATDTAGNNNAFIGYAQGGQWSIENSTTNASSSIGMGFSTINMLVNDGAPNVDYGFDIAGGYVKWRYGDNYYRLPSSLPTVGQVLGVSAMFGNTTQLDWITVSGGGSGSPAGSNGQVQYNNGGVFGADSLFTRDTSTFNTYIGKNIDTPIYQYTVDLGDRISDHAYNGSFVVGETVVGQTSGATAVVQRADSPVLVTSVTGTFQDGETVVGQTSGADLLYSNGGPVQPGDTVLIIEIGSNSLRGIGTVVSTNFTQAIIETTAVVQADDYMGTIVGNTFANTSNSVANIVSQTQVGTQNGSTNVAIGNTVNLLGGTLTGIGSVMSSSSAPGHEAQVFVGSNQTMGLDDTFILSSTNNTTNLGSVIFGGTTILGSSVIQISTGDINGGGSGQSSGIDLNTDNSSSSIVFNVGTNGQIGNLQQNGSVAFGYNALASGNNAFAFGNNAQAQGKYSVSIGGSSIAYNDDSFAIGPYTQAYQQSSFAIGTQLSSYSAYETVIGVSNTAYTPFDAASWNNIDRLFVIGNGQNGSEHNAYTMWKDGSFAYNDDNFQNDNPGIEQNMFYFNYGNHDGNGNPNSKRAIRLGSTLNDEWDIGSGNVGDRSIAIGFNDQSFQFPPNPSFPSAAPVASGTSSFALGSGTVSSGGYSMAIGHSAQATGINAHAFGFGANASGQQSTAVGSLANASGEASIAVGVFAQAQGSASLAIGSGSAQSQNSMSFGIGTAYSIGETNIGMRNTSYVPVNTFSWNLADRLFSIGGGDANAFNPAPNASDALTILKNGQTGIGIDNFEAFTNGNIFQVGDGNTGIIGYVDNGTGNWVAVSDERKKDNITDLSYGLDQVLQLRPTSFNYKRNNEHTIGFIAQQVLPIIPEAVYGTESEGYGMSYATLTPVLVKAIQEMNLNITMLSDTARPNTWREALIAWFESTTNGIRSLVVKDKICVDNECLTKDDIHALLQLKNQTIPPAINIYPVGPNNPPVTPPDSGTPPLDDNSGGTPSEPVPPSEPTPPDSGSNPSLNVGASE